MKVVFDLLHLYGLEAFSAQQEQGEGEVTKTDKETESEVSSDIINELLGEEAQNEEQDEERDKDQAPEHSRRLGNFRGRLNSSFQKLLS